MRRPVRQHRLDGGLQAVGLVAGVEGVAQRHGEGEDAGDRIGLALPGDVGRRAVHRLVERLRPAVFGSGAPSEAEGSMPSEPVSMAATSDSMSPNRLSVTMTSNCFGAADELHGAGVGEHVAELDVREVAPCGSR